MAAGQRDVDIGVLVATQAQIEGFIAGGGGDAGEGAALHIPQRHADGGVGEGTGKGGDVIHAQSRQTGNNPGGLRGGEDTHPGPGTRG
ncbi:hypothetical protein D3C81_1892420 [compost metagenome]